MICLTVRFVSHVVINLFPCVKTIRLRIKRALKFLAILISFNTALLRVRELCESSYDDPNLVMKKKEKKKLKNLIVRIIFAYTLPCDRRPFPRTLVSPVWDLQSTLFHRCPKAILFRRIRTGVAEAHYY